MASPGFNQILVVCVGNICRSPTAEYLLREALADMPDAVVVSAGLGALSGHGVAAQASALLSADGVDCSGHKARQLDAKMLHDADLVLTMELGHIEGILSIAPAVRGKTFLLGKWLGDLEVPDPYRRSDEMFEQVYQLIRRAVDGWLPMLKG